MDKVVDQIKCRDMRKIHTFRFQVSADSSVQDLLFPTDNEIKHGLQGMLKNETNHGLTIFHLASRNLVTPPIPSFEMGPPQQTESDKIRVVGHKTKVGGGNGTGHSAVTLYYIECTMFEDRPG